MGLLDALLYNRGRSTIGVLDADGVTAVSSDQARCGVLSFVGPLTGSRAILLPPNDGEIWIVENRTGGGFALSFTIGAGTTASLAAGARALLYLNDLGVSFATTPLSA